MLEKDSETPIDPEIWQEVIKFDTQTKMLTIEKYAGLNTTMFEEAQLVFQSKLMASSSDMSYPYNLVKLTVKENETLEVKLPEPPGAQKAPQAPKFEFNLPLLTISENFTEGGELSVIKYDLPQIDDAGLGLSEDALTFLNLEDYPYVKYDKEKRQVSLDPNDVPKADFNKSINIRIRLENIDGVYQEFVLGFLVTNTDDIPADADITVEE